VACACSRSDRAKLSPEPDPRPTIPLDAPGIDAPSAVDGIPVVFAIPREKHESIRGFAFDHDHIFVVTIASRLLRASKAGGHVDTMIEAGWLADSGQPLIGNDEQRRMGQTMTDNPRVPPAMDRAIVKELEKEYERPIVRDEFVYLGNFGTHMRDNADRTIERIPVGGGKLEVVAQNLPSVDNYVVDGTSIYIELPDSSIARFADHTTTTLVPANVDRAERLWADDGDALIVTDRTHRGAGTSDVVVKRYPKSGKPPTVLGHAAASPSELYIDSTRMFWLSNDRQLWRLERGGGAPVMIARLDTATYNVDVECDDTDIYVLTGQRLTRIGKAGNDGASLVANVPDGSKLIGVDATTIWLLDGDLVLALKKPSR
jgi:hypothetical protein